MTLWTRRGFVQCGLGVLALPRGSLSRGGAPPLAEGRVLVVVQARGGWDGLSMVVPAADDTYRRVRPCLALQPRQELRLQDAVDLWWHPELRGLQALFERGWLAIVPNVGHPHPDLSHFESEAKWHTADPQGNERTGWLARLLAQPGVAPGNAPLPAVTIEDRPSGSFAGRDVPAFDEPGRLAWGAAAAERERARAVAAAAARAGDAVLGALARRWLAALDVAGAVEQAGRTWRAGTVWPATGLAARLRTCAQLVTSRQPPVALHVAMPGFDTHTQQCERGRPAFGQLAQCLQEFGDALLAFCDDLRAQGAAGRVLVLAHSEFGRSVAENHMLGTEHGHGGVAFLAGPGVRGGLHGHLADLAACAAEPANLGIPFDARATDYRAVYATILERWLRVPSQPVLGGRFAPLAALP